MLLKVRTTLLVGLHGRFYCNLKTRHFEKPSQAALNSKIFVGFHVACTCVHFLQDYWRTYLYPWGNTYCKIGTARQHRTQQFRGILRSVVSLSRRTLLHARSCHCCRRNTSEADVAPAGLRMPMPVPVHVHTQAYSNQSSKMIATLECHAWRLIVTVSIIWPVVAGVRNSIRGIQHELRTVEPKP